MRRSANQVLYGLEARVARLEGRTKTAGKAAKDIKATYQQVGIETVKGFCSNKSVLNAFSQRVTELLNYHIADAFAAGKGLSPKGSVSTMDIDVFNVEFSDAKWVPKGSSFGLHYTITGDVTLVTGEVHQVFLDAFMDIPMPTIEVK